jgi:hypothetical protein
VESTYSEKIHKTKEKLGGLEEKCEEKLDISQFTAI